MAVDAVNSCRAKCSSWLHNKQNACEYDEQKSQRYLYIAGSTGGMQRHVFPQMGSLTQHNFGNPVFGPESMFGHHCISSRWEQNLPFLLDQQLCILPNSFANLGQFSLYLMGVAEIGPGPIYFRFPAFITLERGKQMEPKNWFSLHMATNVVHLCAMPHNLALSAIGPICPSPELCVIWRLFT